MNVDPYAADAAVKLAVNLTETLSKNTVSYVINKREQIKLNNEKDTIIREYEELTNRLMDDNSQFENIAKSYKAMYEQIEITPENLEYLQNTIRGVLSIISGQSETTKDQEDGFEMLLDLVTVDTLKTMQLLGFNYKKAIGEPLTEICAEKIKNWGNLNSKQNGNGKRK
ncbi:hypothetical protein MPH61_24015 [Peribacillus muralis]|uniref:hypothetical protein n=1 Tax=Peribacillus muralis TaxID=264697 RepID=UPI001F4D72DB|nr:hypothetical protein [Peribacillus muralis]MCK1995600.1 hypothetical protein [Peribacillus muralis]MCK2016158.1 hypothetical protein [Peribacillus muralis]